MPKQLVTDAEPLVGAADAAERVRKLTGVPLTLHGLRYLARTGKLPAGRVLVRCGRRCLFRASALIDFLNAGGSPPPTRPAA